MPSATSALEASAYRFCQFSPEPGERRLLSDGKPVALGTRGFDLLVALVARAGRLVTKNELLTLVWPGLVVEENKMVCHRRSGRVVRPEPSRRVALSARRRGRRGDDR